MSYALMFVLLFEQKLANFTSKRQIRNILGFSGQKVIATMTHPVSF